MEVFTVHDVETTHSGDPFGVVSGGKITGTGPTVEASIVFESRPDTRALNVGIQVEGEDKMFNIVCDICQWEPGSEEWTEMLPSDRLVEREEVICLGMLVTVHSILPTIHPATWLICKRIGGNLKRIGVMNFGTFVPTMNNCFAQELAQYAKDQRVVLV